MNINEVKDLMQEFDTSSLREFSWTNDSDVLIFSKNEQAVISKPGAPQSLSTPSVASPLTAKVEESSVVSTDSTRAADGELLTSPLVGVVYLSSAPDKPEFIHVGDHVKKGQTLLIIEAMKVMNEIPAPQDGRVTEILVQTDEVVEYGQELVRIK